MRVDIGITCVKGELKRPTCGCRRWINPTNALDVALNSRLKILESLNNVDRCSDRYSLTVRREKDVFHGNE
jgi:hypothetical protein